LLGRPEGDAAQLGLLDHFGQHLLRGTLLAENGTGFALPGTRPYHLADFFLIHFALGVPHPAAGSAGG
jgi:hypothetical protein